MAGMMYVGCKWIVLCLVAVCEAVWSTGRPSEAVWNTGGPVKLCGALGGMVKLCGVLGSR